MPKYDVKTPVRLERAEIIRSDKIKIIDRMAKVPVLEIFENAIQDIIESNFQDIIGKDLKQFTDHEEITENKIEEIKKLETKPVFIDEFTISNFDQPVSISFSKVPEGTMPLSEVQVEVQNAYDKGFNDGQQITVSTFKAELETHQQWVRNIDKVVKELQEHYVKELNKMEDSLAYLAILAAEHILEREISANSNIVIEQTRKAISSLDDEIIFKIHLNPDDIEILREAKSELLQDSSVLNSVELTSDISVARGGCILETNVGNIDARLKSQLEKLREPILEAVKNTESEPFPVTMKLNSFDSDSDNNIGSSK